MNWSQEISQTWSLPVPFTATAALVLAVYSCGWLNLRRAAAHASSAVELWRGFSFLCGIFLIWVAVASPLAALDDESLTVHMVQHLLLMTVAPLLILLGKPALPLLHGLPARVVQFALGPFLRSHFVKAVSRLCERMAFCWIFSIGVLIGWHVPYLFTAALKSETWHVIEHFSFLLGGFLFWSPVIPVWPNVRLSPQWSQVLYLFLATLPCDILSAFLVFSDRVVYPVYLGVRRSWDWPVLADQQCAGALMWTSVTILYLVPAAILTLRLLEAKPMHQDELVRSDFH